MKHSARLSGTARVRPEGGTLRGTARARPEGSTLPGLERAEPGPSQPPSRSERHRGLGPQGQARAAAEHAGLPARSLARSETRTPAVWNH